MSGDRPGLDWEDLRVAREVLGRGGYAVAATRLGMAHATARRRLEHLEYRLGVALFTHAPEGLTPTPAAEAMGADLDLAAGAASAFTRLLSGPLDRPEGVVRVSAPPLIVQDVLPALWSDLRWDHPRLALEMAGGRQSGASAVRSGLTDLAVTLEAPRGPDLEGRPCGRIAVGLYAHRHYLAEAGAGEAPASLAGLDLIGLLEADSAAPVARALELPASPADYAFRTTSVVALIAAIRAGLGVGPCPRFVARRHSALTAVLPERRICLEAWVITRRDMAGISRIALVRDRLAAAVSGLAGGD